MNMSLEDNKVIQNILDGEIVDLESLKSLLMVINHEKNQKKPKTLKKTFVKANSNVR